MKVRAKPFSDKEGFSVICNRCMNTNSLINVANPSNPTNISGDVCSSCGHPFIRNFIGFDTLPLVEFLPRADILPKKVIEFLKMDPPDEINGSVKQTQKPKKR